MCKKIEVLPADITTLQVDAVVSSANQYLIAGGGVCGAIHKAAGPELEQACKVLDGCEVGQAKITAAYNLPAKYVIHTVGPVYFDGTRNEDSLLASCYREVMNLANKNGVKSIAFPLISGGIYGYPLDEACNIAITEVLKALSVNETAIERVIFAYVQREVGEYLIKHHSMECFHE